MKIVIFSQFSRRIQVIILIFLAGFLVGHKALAHQPRIVFGLAEVQVENPEISQAFYGILSGSPQTYKIDSNKDFTLYVNLLVPKLPNIKKDLSVKIYKERELISTLNGTDYKWKEFYEPFGGDYYYQGPEFKQEVGPGEYSIKMSSPDNQGKYSLAIGEQESFPLCEIVNTIQLLPKLKKDFFEKSALTAYFNYTGLVLLFVLLIVAIIILVIFKIAKR